ncbi:MAG: UDP-N-acetylmuramate dehydrogenase [Bacteroidales bacterium]|nr:UDP-N-acetylmuramate dehydrogenase [Bacteroidales bacterium]
MEKTYSFDLSGKNTFRMKVSCRCFIEYDSIADLIDIDFEDLLRPVKHIGAGSNILFTEDFPGTILHSRIKFIERIKEEGDEVLVSVGAGVVFDDFCAWAAGEGLWGPENLSHIPGEVGASAVQNVGAYGVEAKDIIKTVFCYDTLEEEMTRFEASECGFGYRDSIFKHEGVKDRYIVTHIVFRLSKAPAPKLDYGHIREALGDKELSPAAIRETITAVRRDKLPEVTDLGSAGSFFKNPVVPEDIYNKVKAVVGGDVKVPAYFLEDGLVKIPAAFLIEQCGFKGRRSGNVAVWDKQPLVIVNATGRALPDEVITLENKIRVSVREKFGISLVPEVEHI